MSRLTLFGVTLALAAVVTSRQVVAQQTPIAITGTLRDSLTDTPVERATIQPPDGRAVQTDAGGRFRIVVAATTGQLLIRRVGYEPRVIDLRSLPHSETGMDVGIIRLSPLVFALDPLRVEYDETRRATLMGMLRDSATNTPLDRATVYLPGGQQTQTDRRGVFRLSKVRQNSGMLFFRRLGYAPRVIFLRQIKWADSIDIGSLGLSPLALRLDSIAIAADMVARNPHMADFYRRRRAGMGKYFTREDIWKKNPTLLTDLVRTLPQVTVSCTMRAADGTGLPCQLATMRRGRYCPLTVMLNGLPMVGLTGDEIAPDWVAGIEVYLSTNFTPVDVAVRPSQCGTLVIWTGANDY
jgi:hypothetical protein